MALYPHAAAHPPRLTRAWGLTCGGVATRPSTLVPYRTRPALVAVGMAAVPAPATPPLGWPQCPDPRRVSIHPQPTRAPREKAKLWVPSGDGDQPGQWQGAPRSSGEVAVRQGAQPPRHCGSPWRRV